jgi:hypothetical protein
MIVEAEGDVLRAPVVAHVCDCVSVRPYGLGRLIALRHPWADVYGQRMAYPGRNHAVRSAIPGTILVSQSKDRTFIHMFAQVLPGKPGQFSLSYQGYDPDSFADRLDYFMECVRRIDKRFTEVAVPVNLGCVPGDGSWAFYRKVLEASPVRFILYHPSQPR